MPSPATRPATAKRLADAKQAALAETQTPSEAFAYALVREFGDLEPSVNRIMTAELTEAGRMHVITLFRASLGVPGDPHRMPANAIEAGRLIDAAG